MTAHAELARFLDSEQVAGRLESGPIKPSPEAYAKVRRAHLN